MTKDLLLLTVARYLQAAVASGRAKKPDWQAWADRVIESSDSLDDWIIDLSVAKSDEQAEAALFSATRDSADSDAIVGHLWRRREAEEITLSEFLARGAQQSNGSVAFWYDFDQLHEDLEAGVAETILIARIPPHVVRFAELADRQWRELFPNASVHGDD